MNFLPRFQILLSTLAAFAALLTFSTASLAGIRDLSPEVIEANGVKLAMVEIGDPQGEPVLMIMGLGSSYRLWGEKLPQGLADAGYRVILFDNRDVGASQRMDHLGDPVLWWQLLKNNLGFGVNAVYSLSDMAEDAAALLDHLEIERAHVVGASMGGMIAQVLAVEQPQRVKSLVSIMSTSGAEHLPEPTPEAQKSLENATFTSEEELTAVNERGFYPQGVPRQILAVLDAGDRSAAIKAIRAPTLVIHGRDDGLLPLAHGEHTARLIPNARMEVIEGMAHNLPLEVVPQLVGHMVGHWQ
ncbi:alpha/beta fold hydrolase [Pseudomaricurvus alkylphenolicus]|uniref:alpha/beta fold hydrolase n=1 Tax=Pseudomaricurvus alkylphenolicus TaxID=1306991 RepID=UPI00141E1C14|nr:alpha/beta fold hydrolase [Pseudomaricurvus alkylphenolicus]NIB42583.1 alpha/beta fold hydrolase [Pseudomaricurvus alkylphenolicus]